MQGLAGVAQQASEDLGPGAQEAKLIAHAVKVNVFQMNFLLKFSELLRDLVRKGDLQIQGGIYHLASAGKVLQSMRADLNKMGQAPHTALVGCADSRAALETVFDAFPGDLFVLRNAANTCTHAEGSVLGSLEFCTGALNTRLIFVLGHTACGAIKGATKAFLESKKSGGAKKDGFNSCNAPGEVLLNRESLRKLAVASGSLFCSLHVCRMAMRWTRCCGA